VTVNVDDARAVLSRIPAIAHTSDLDLLIFFAKHPRTLMSSEQLARLLGYQLSDVAHSLDVLLSIGILTRTQNPARLPRMYCFTADGDDGWLPRLMTLGSTRAGRLALRHALSESRTSRTAGRARESAQADGRKETR
jgi:hypothetical protein